MDPAGEELSVIELPEAAVLAAQLRESVVARTVRAARAATTAHRLTWYFGDPAGYGDLLEGRTVAAARAWGGHVELELTGEVLLVLSEGASPRLIAAGATVPERHQLRLDLDDGSTLVVTIAMYGGVQAFPDGANDNRYYLLAREAPSPLADGFDAGALLATPRAERLSAKALLATEQRVPGLGNGVLQDILWTAGVHPRSKVADLSDDARRALVAAVPAVLRRMADQGGRDTERDLYGRPGGYRTVLSRHTVELPCPRCGGPVTKEQYLGGAVYFCRTCQPLDQAARRAT